MGLAIDVHFQDYRNSFLCPIVRTAYASVLFLNLVQALNEIVQVRETGHEKLICTGDRFLAWFSRRPEEIDRH